MARGGDHRDPKRAQDPARQPQTSPGQDAGRRWLDTPESVAAAGDRKRLGQRRQTGQKKAAAPRAAFSLAHGGLAARVGYDDRQPRKD